MNEITKRPPNFEKLKEYTQEEIDFVEAPMGPIEKGENHIKEPEVEYEPEECPNPECPSMMQYAPGIGPFCPNKECDVGDGPDVWKKEDEKLTEEKEDVKVEKKVVKKKLSGIWD